VFDQLDDAGAVDAITTAARGQNAMYARELAAIGELYARRAPADDAERFNWAVDGHENVVAERRRSRAWRAACRPDSPTPRQGAWWCDRRRAWPEGYIPVSGYWYRLFVCKARIY
jgi:hypothetical protein